MNKGNFFAFSCKFLVVRNNKDLCGGIKKEDGIVLLRKQEIDFIRRREDKKTGRREDCCCVD